VAPDGCTGLHGLHVCRGEMDVNTVYWSRYRVAIDPAVEPPRLPRRARRVLLTHGHADHTRYAAALREEGATVLAPRLCLPLVEDPRLNHMATTGWAGPVPEDYITRYFLGPGTRVDYTIEPGMALPGVAAHAAPGHTPGSLVYLVHADAAVLVAGDAVYGSQYLRETPILYHTDTAAWTDTLSRLKTLDFDALVPGHGEPASSRREAMKLIDRNIEKIGEMLRLALSALDPDEWITGDEAAMRLAELTGYARSRRAYSILAPTTRALLHHLAEQGQAERTVYRGVIMWRRR